MQRLKILALSLMAVFALGAMASATASAEELPNFLPLGTEANPVTFTDKSGAGTLETVGGKVVKCTSDTSTGEVTAPRLGKFDVLFLGCESSGIKCTGLKDTTTGSVLVKGTFHIRTLLTEKKHVYVIFLIEHVHFSCLLLVLVLGCAAGLLLSPNVLSSTLTIHLKQTKGVQEPTEIASEGSGSTDEKCTLSTSIGGGAEEQSGELTEDTVENFEQGGKKVTALVMTV
jgi:hypothetical protein